MPKKWTHTAAFEQFGTKPRNVNWSWSARNETSRTVVVTLWQDEFEKKGDELTYSRPAYSNADRPKSLGFPELLANLAWARDNCEGRFHVIIAIAKDTTADPRSISECFPSKMVMRLTALDETGGAWSAVAEGL